MDFWFLAAGGLSFAITLLHLFAGGPAIAAPLLAAKELDATAKYVNYYCWHLVSISLALMAATFLWSGLNADAWEAAVLGTVMAGAFCIWGIALVIIKQLRFRDVPQGWFFLPIAAMGVYGFLV
jgi:surface polysaccharide O-acyltransferase-like enzyme